MEVFGGAGGGGTDEGYEWREREERIYGCLERGGGGESEGKRGRGSMEERVRIMDLWRQEVKSRGTRWH